MTVDPAGPLPLVIGVTGHRDMCPAHGDELHKAFAKAVADLKGSHDVPVVVISALAQGADRFAADAALKCGCELVVALPMPKDEYEADFRRLGESEEAIGEFNRLFGLSRSQYLVAPKERERFGPYGAVGRDVASSSHALIAFWDGGADEPIGGTAWVVNERRGNHRRLEINVTPRGPVYHIPVHRKGSCPGEAAEFKSEWLPPREPPEWAAKLEDFVEHSCGPIERFNRDAKRLFPETGRLDLEKCYQIADALALKFRRRTDVVFVVLFLLLLLSTASFAIFAHVESHPVASLKAYMVFAAAAVVTYALARICDWQNRGQDYRALAEGLRVGCAWQLCGIPDFASQSYLLRQPPGAKWIRDALAALERTAVPGEAPLYEPRSKAALKATIQHWVRPELQYYADAGRGVEKWLTRFERLAVVLVAASVIIAVSTSLREAPSSGAGRFVEENFGAMLVLSTVLAVGAGLLDAFAEKRAWKEHGHRYKHMARFLRELVEQLDVAGEDQTAQAIDVLQKAGQEELDENSDWLQTHRERPLDLTHLGG